MELKSEQKSYLALPNDPQVCLMTATGSAGILVIEQSGHMDILLNDCFTKQTRFWSQLWKDYLLFEGIWLGRVETLVAWKYTLFNWTALLMCHLFLTRSS